MMAMDDASVVESSSFLHETQNAAAFPPLSQVHSFVLFLLPHRVVRASKFGIAMKLRLL